MSSFHSCPISVLFALPEEAKHCRSLERNPRIKIAVSGMGEKKASEAVRQLAHERGLEQALIICGFAGGLKEEALPGALIVAQDVLSDEIPPRRYSPDPLLRSLAIQVSAQNLNGNLISARRTLITSQEKRAFAQRTGGCAVDMETLGAAHVAESLGIPWCAVRAITDSVAEDMPLDFNALCDADGNPDRSKIVRATLLNPQRIPALIRLGGRSATAAKNLAAYLEAFVEALSVYRNDAIEAPL